MNKTTIPKTLDQTVDHMALEEKLRAKIGVMVFLSKIAKSKQSFETSGFQNYKILLNKVTHKIEKWHNQIGREKFENDADFIEHEVSPSKFETSSEEEV
jgi:hypothetical protein